MAREPRMFQSGRIGHLVPKGNDGREIFLDDDHRANFLGRAGTIFPRYEIELIGYCVMGNHVHMLVIVRGRGEALSEAMMVLLGSYSRWWNRVHGRTGHLFEARFFETEVRTDRHLIAAARYIDLNPVAANMHSCPEEYEWSSYRAHVGLRHPPSFLANSAFLALVGATPDRARAAYEEFVRDRLPGAVWPPPSRPLR